MSIVLQRFAGFALAVLAGLVFFTGTAFAAGDYSDYDDADIDTIEIIVGPVLSDGFHESDVKVVFEDGEILVFDMSTNNDEDHELRDSVAETLQYTYQMEGNFNQSDLDQYTQIKYQTNTQVTSEEGVKNLWVPGDDMSEYTIDDFESIKVWPGDKHGWIAVYGYLDNGKTVLVLSERYEDVPTLDILKMEVINVLEDDLNISGALNEAVINKVLHVEFDDYDYYGDELEYAQAELHKCSELTKGSIETVNVTAVSQAVFAHTVTVMYNDGCEFSYGTNIYKVDSANKEKNTIEEVVERINNSELATTPDVTYADISNAIEFAGVSYSNDSSPEVADVASLRAQLMQLIALLQQLLQLQSLFGN